MPTFVWFMAEENENMGGKCSVHDSDPASSALGNNDCTSGIYGSPLCPTAAPISLQGDNDASSTPSSIKPNCGTTEIDMPGFRRT